MTLMIDPRYAKKMQLERGASNSKRKRIMR